MEAEFPIDSYWATIFWACLVVSFVYGLETGFLSNGGSDAGMKELQKDA